MTSGKKPEGLYILEREGQDLKAADPRLHLHRIFQSLVIER